MTEREALKLALAEFENQKAGLNEVVVTDHNLDDLITVIKEALAQPEHEPVAWEGLLGVVARGWCHEENVNKTMDIDLAAAIAKEVQALYTTPPQRTWVGLTYGEKSEIYHHQKFVVGSYSPAKYADAIEAKLKEKNT